MIDKQILKTKITSFNSEAICAIIVVNKYLNQDNECTSTCMKELAARRANGEDFDFETFIDEEFKKLPVVNTESLDFRTILGSFV